MNPWFEHPPLSCCNRIDFCWFSLQNHCPGCWQGSEVLLVMDDSFHGGSFRVKSYVLFDAFQELEGSWCFMCLNLIYHVLSSSLPIRDDAQSDTCEDTSQYISDDVPSSSDEENEPQLHQDGSEGETSDYQEHFELDEEDTRPDEQFSDEFLDDDEFSSPMHSTTSVVDPFSIRDVGVLQQLVCPYVVHCACHPFVILSLRHCTYRSVTGAPNSLHQSEINML